MKMGSRRRGGGGGSTSTGFESVLRRNIESFKHKHARHRRRDRNLPPLELPRVAAIGESTHSSEEAKGIDEEESTSESEETDGAVSTSEDAIYGERIEPEFDLMKSMLRANYSDSKDARKLKRQAGKDKVEKNVELEMDVDYKATQKVDLLGGKDGPRFRDLGGMDGVVEELKMEVIVPLYHPHLPRWLGVRPMAGILLHGPPGCGKTKLAHAIANETGVPFYKISATELVSGVTGVGLGIWDLVLFNRSFAWDVVMEVFVGLMAWAYLFAMLSKICSKLLRTRATLLADYWSSGQGESSWTVDTNRQERLLQDWEMGSVMELVDLLSRKLFECSGMISLVRPYGDPRPPTRVAFFIWLVQPVDVDPNAESSNIRPGYVLVIGATNRPDAVDPALRRPGRFDREIVLGVPDENARVEILSVLTRNLRVEGAFDLVKIARSTPGFVGADLAALANKAGNLAMKRIIDRRKCVLSLEPRDGDHTEDWWRNPWLPEEMENLSITMSDFEEAAKLVQPSSRREGFSTVPNVKWEDVGGLHLLRQEFDRYIVRRIKYPEDYEGFGVDLETGFLLYGPPGCGKTLIAKAVANEAGANFIHIKGPELLSKYVGESELAVRTIFSRARTCSPCILFFDEVDALTTKRGKEGGWVVERLLNQLLIELDGAEHRQGVYVIGATNRPEVMDRALLRPGRFGKLLYVPLPSPDERGLILKALSRNKPIDGSVDLIAVGRDEACENLSGADLSALMNEAAMAALEERQIAQSSDTPPSTTPPSTIKKAHFEQALKKISPSVSDKQKQYYHLLSESFRAA
ncbi:cell division cycle 48C [Actinidia rufa]|uniref:Cell division cycle 48C n=1 Tax=Actinidia rufa TaxID=165716 RepID=A0A7J0FY11_9ERIC|nr:cell division cycle 48C [Actinidia rufa]